MNKTKVTLSQIEDEIVSEFYFTAKDGVLGQSQMGTAPANWTGLEYITICVIVTRNGTKLVGVNEGSVSPENFSEKVGRTLAREKAIDQMWPLLGYELRSKLKAQHGTT